MPLYDFECSCGFKQERILGMDDCEPVCPHCHGFMYKKPNSNIMVKWKGEGGYPSRHKQWFNTTKRIHPELT